MYAVFCDAGGRCVVTRAAVGATVNIRMTNSRTTTKAMIPNTFTQRGVPVASPVSLLVSG